MNLGRIFAHAIVRRVAYVVAAALLAWCGITEAHAACNETTFVCATRPEAYARAASNTLTTTCGTGSPEFMVEGNNYPNQPYTGYTKWVRCPNGTGWHPWQRPSVATNPIWGWSVSCPLPDEEWSESGKDCVSPAECLAKNSEEGFKDVGATVRPFTNRCVGGCEFRIQGSSVGVTGSDGVTRWSGEYGFSGTVCDAALPVLTEQAAKEQKPQECVPLGSGQTVCLKRNGDHCYAASTGKQICWDPRGTGIKNSDNVQQKRDAGNTPIPPNLNLPNGDTLSQSGTPTTTSTTINNNSTTSTVTTTTTNYVTTNGTNPGDTDSGEPADGSGSAPSDGDGEENGASGGGSCSQPPATTGDPILGMIATQTWKVRCAVLGSGIQSTGDIENCALPYTVSSTDPDAKKDVEILRSLRAINCPDEVQPVTEPGEGEYLGDPGSSEGFLTDHEIGADGLDDSGLGFGETCPTLPSVDVMGQTITFNTDVFCDWMLLGGQFVLIISALISLRVLGSGTSI